MVSANETVESAVESLNSIVGPQVFVCGNSTPAMGLLGSPAIGL